MSQAGNILVNGNEAIALAAISSGIDFFAHYPGSPVNLVEPALRSYSTQFGAEVVFNDSINEHVAALSAGGASFTGARSMVVMKHVGLNIAADPLTYLAYTGVEGGMVVVVGTDPGANASTGEQDVHWYARMFNLPLFEPTTVAETYDLCCRAFDLSEKFGIPCLLFLPTRLAYDSERIPLILPANRDKKKFQFVPDKERYINVGERNIRNHKKLLEKIRNISEEENLIKIIGGGATGTAIITRGLTYPMVYEALHSVGAFDRVRLLNADMVYPVARQQLKKLLEGVREIYVVEDQDGFLESELKMHLGNELGAPIYGKEYFPSYGEITIMDVQRFLAGKLGLQEPTEATIWGVGEIPESLGTFCEGCPHRSVYYVLDKLISEGIPGIIGGDIGCSSLPPFRADWLMCMNAGIGISQGISQMETGQVVFSTGGDGSFFHGGLLSLKSAVANKIDLLHLVLDNKTVAMTGHQDSPSGDDRFDPKKLLKELGVDKSYVVQANDIKKLEKILKKEAGGRGVRVVWIEGNCSQLYSPWREFKKNSVFPEIKFEKCGDCTECYHDLGCPAIDLREDGNGFKIDLEVCARCGTCKTVCKHNAVKASFKGMPRNLYKACQKR